MKSLIICGKPGIKVTESLTSHCTRISCLTGYDLSVVLKSSKYIICRSGYSTIMDLMVIKKTAFLVPTPGQTEQEYLARYLQKQGLFLYSEQKDFTLQKAIRSLDAFSPRILLGERPDLLNQALNRLDLLPRR